VDVNVAAEGVDVALLKAAQLKDAGDDGIAARGVGREDFASGTPVFEDGAERSALADLACDLQITDRGGVGAKTIAYAVPRGGHREAGDGVAVLHDGYTLIRDADDGAPASLGGTEAQGEQKKEAEKSNRAKHAALKSTGYAAGQTERGIITRI
jgi:hypothetical protein